MYLLYIPSILRHYHLFSGSACHGASPGGSEYIEDLKFLSVICYVILDMLEKVCQAELPPARRVKSVGQVLKFFISEAEGHGHQRGEVRERDRKVVGVCAVVLEQLFH